MIPFPVRSLFKIRADLSDIEKYAALWRGLSSVPIVRAGRLLHEKRPSVGFGNCLYALLYGNYDDIDSNTKVTTQRGIIFSLDSSQTPLHHIDEQYCILDSARQHIFSPSGNVAVEISKMGTCTSSEQQEWRFHITIADNDTHITILKAPAAPIRDALLQNVSWSSKEDAFVFVGEKKRRRCIHPWNVSSPQDAATSRQISSWETKDNWGEGFVDNTIFTIYKCDLALGTIVDLIDDTFSEKYSSVYPLWLVHKGADKLLFNAVEHGKRRLGIIYCPNRSQTLCSLGLSPSGDASIPKPLGAFSCFRGVRNMKLFEGRLAFFALPLTGSPSMAGHHPHNTAVSLHIATLDEVFDEGAGSDLWQRSLVVPIPLTTPDDPETGFHGLYPNTGNDLWWIKGGQALLVSTIARSGSVLYVIPATSEVASHGTRLADPQPLRPWASAGGSWSVLDVQGNSRALLLHSHITRGQTAVLYDFETDCHYEAKIPSRVDGLLKTHYETNIIRVPESRDTEALYHRAVRSGDDGQPRPTLLFVHGGPHSTDVGSFNYGQLFTLLSGWDVVSVNYGGSLGFGQHRVLELLGNVGRQDVDDCVAVVQKLLAQKAISTSKLVVSGGSHGGFLSAHLTGQYPDLFRAALIRNPVINLSTVLYESDIPDWALAEAGVLESSPDIEKMRSMSPIIHAHKVKAATLLGIGKDDLRVPPAQGRSWYHALRASPQAPLVRMLEYDNNAHPLDGVHAAADFAIRGALFIQEAILSDEQ